MTDRLSHAIDDYFCTDLSRAADELLAGTVKQTTTWLLLEYDGPWGAKAFEESDLPQAVKAQLAGHLEAIPASRLLLIKQRQRGSRSKSAFFVALTDDADPTLYRFELDAYEDLLSLDIPAVVARDEAHDAQRSEEKLFLVCTNGRRDRCCARHGVEVYEGLDGAAGASAWECSHVGGHRFAANVLCFPHGLCYGRVGAEDVPALVGDYGREAIRPANLRGRACYQPVAQAADYYLRVETGVTDLDAFRLVEIQDEPGGGWLTAFRSVTDGAVHRLSLSVAQSGDENYVSCGGGKTAPVTRYRLEAYSVSEPA